MSVKTYKEKIPSVVNAIQWTGKNTDEIRDILGGAIIMEQYEGPNLLSMVVSTSIARVNLEPGCYIVISKPGDIYVFDERFFNDHFEIV